MIELIVIPFVVIGVVVMIVTFLEFYPRRDSFRPPRFQYGEADYEI